MPISSIHSKPSFLPIPSGLSATLKGALALLSPFYLGEPVKAASPLTVNEAIRLALEREPSFQVAQKKVDVASAQSRQAGLWQNPQLQFTLDDWPVNGAGWSASKRVVGFSQTVPFPGKKNTDRQLGESGVRLAEAELLQQRRELIRNVKVAFYESVAARELVAAKSELVAAAELLADSVKNRVEAGGAADQEFIRAEIAFERARVDWMDSQRDFAVAKSKLAQWIGQPDLVPQQLQGDLPGPKSGKLPELPANQPLRIAAQENVRRAEWAGRRANLEIYPDVSVGVGIGKDGGSVGTMGQVEIGIPLPIFDTSRAKRQEAQANRSIAQSQAQAVELRLANEWRNARDRVRVAEEQALVFQQRILPKAQAALEQVKAGYAQGKYGVADLLDTQRSTSETKVGYQQKLLELNIARAELEALAGQPGSQNE